MKRRELILAGAAIAAPVAPALASSATGDVDRETLIRVLDRLETFQDWESCCVVAAKSFAAWQFRRALSLPMPDRSYVQMHISFQKKDYEQYKNSEWGGRALESGADDQFPLMEWSLD